MAADAAVDADEGTTGIGPIPGDWRLAWTCLQGCAIGDPRPPEVGREILQVVRLTVMYRDTPGAGGVAHGGATIDGDCLRVPATAGDDWRDAYRICRTGPAVIRAEITWGFDSPPAVAQWSVTGRPL